MDATILMQDLTKGFHGKIVVDHLSLAIPRGAIYALLGENGAGKTTTIRMLTGLLPPDQGKALILGQDCWKSAVDLRRRVGYVPERPRFYDWMSVSEIGWFAGGFHGKEFLPRYHELARKFQLDARQKIKDLSKGQYAKVGLALALAPDPEVLILDEPTSGLDLLVRREFLSSMIAMAGEGKTILISSHQVVEVERVASHAAFLHQGRLILAASMDELKQRVVRFRLRFGDQPPNAAALGRVLQKDGTGRQWQAVICDPDRKAVEALRTTPGIDEFEETPLGLEDVYCALMAQEEGEA